MRSTLMSFAVKAALFLLIANIVMLIFVPFGTAEWYITIISAGLMAVLIAGGVPVERVCRLSLWGKGGG